MPCLYRVGHAAARPDELTENELNLLIEAHGDVVDLVRVKERNDLGQSVLVNKWFWKAATD